MDKNFEIYKTVSIVKKYHDSSYIHMYLVYTYDGEPLVCVRDHAVAATGLYIFQS